MCDVRAFGAVGDGHARDTAAIQAAIQACSAAGGGQVVVPAGVFVVGTLELQDNVELHLMQGATLRGSPDQADYTKRYNAPYDNGFPSEGTYGFHLITAWRKTNIAITGRGEIDGNGPAFFGPPVPSPIKDSVWDRTGRWRPAQMIGLVECVSVRIADITCRNSPYWTIWPYACREVVITGVKIRNDWKSPNGDGIDPDCCSNVIIANCDIQSGDDAIALRADRACSGLALDLENVTITNCILSTPLGGLRFGPTGDLSSIRNITVSNCTIQADCGLLFSQSVAKGYWEKGVLIENVRISNMMIRANTVLAMTMPDTFNKPSGFRNIAISQVSAAGGGGCVLTGSDGGVFDDISLSDFQLIPSFVGSLRCKRVLSRNLIQVRNVQNLALRNFRVDLGEVNPAEEGAVVHGENVGSLVLSGIDVVSRPGRQERAVCKRIGKLRVADCEDLQVEAQDNA